MAMPDWSTLVPVPWERDLSAVIADVHDEARRAARRRPAAARCAGPSSARGRGRVRGARSASSTSSTSSSAARRPTRASAPAGRATCCRRRPRVAGLQPVALRGHARVRRRRRRPCCAAYGVEIEAWSTELGYGMIECADDAAAAARRRPTPRRGSSSALKELAKRHGLVATFIAKWDMAQSGSSGHLHQSLLRDGENAFCGGEQDDACRRPAATTSAACIEHAPELSAFSHARTSTRYRRPIPGAVGADQRHAGAGTTARRPSARSRSTQEASRGSSTAGPGADLNPYLAIAACLDSGLRGVARGDRAAAGVGRSGPSTTRRCRPSRRRWRRPPTRWTRSKLARAVVRRRATSTTTSRRAAPRPATCSDIAERAGAGLRDRALLRDRLMIDLDGQGRSW